MSNTCGNIVSGLVAAICGQAPASGTGKRVYIGNHEDIDKVNSVFTDKQLSSLVMKAGTVAYLFESMPKATTGEATFSRGSYFNLYDHAVTLRVFTKNQTSKDFMNILGDSRCFVIVENVEVGTAGEVKFEVYGWDSGLTLSELPFSTTFADSTVYAAKLSSDDDSKEGQLPISFFNTDLDTTESSLEALITVI